MELIPHSFEAGRRGKPDELDSNIAHLLASHLLQKDPDARFDIRVHGQYDRKAQKPKLLISGEVSEHLLHDARLYHDLTNLVLVFYNRIHRSVLDDQQIIVEYNFNNQEHTLARNLNNGDIGRPLAVAFRESPCYLPDERFLAVSLRDLFDSIHDADGYLPRDLAEKTDFDTLYGLGADGKITVDALYTGVKLDRIEHITLTLHHRPEIPVKKFTSRVERIVRGYLQQLEEKYSLRLGNRNPSLLIHLWEGRSGWEADEGTREAKAPRQLFGTHGVMEDSPAGEDPSKPSGTGTFLARYIAVQIVGNGIADYARVLLRYEMGQPGAEIVGINTHNTAHLPQSELIHWANQNIPLGLNDTIKRFNLRDSALYRQIALDSDFFHSADLPWNKLEVEYK